MQILKTFIGPSGAKHKPGDKVPADWDKSRIDHYSRHGMVGTPPKAPRKTPAPSETKPAAPANAKNQSAADVPTTAADATAPAAADAPADTSASTADAGAGAD